MKDRLKFKKNSLNENQSLKYQIMLILMEEHKRARLNKEYIGVYLGDDYLAFDENDWRKICSVIEYSISENHKVLVNETKDYMMLEEFVFSLLESENFCYEFSSDDVSKSKTFSITPDGYSYQFNGYMRSQDKANKQNSKLTKWIMSFTGITTFYYIGSWFIKDLNILNFAKYINITLSFINILYINLFKFMFLLFVNLFLAYYLVKFIVNKFKK